MSGDDGNTLLLRDAGAALVDTGNGPQLQRDISLLLRDGWIERIGPAAELAGHAAATIDVSRHVLVPGLINTHHHFFQTLTRCWPAAQSLGLFDWLRAQYPLWSRIDPPALHAAARVTAMELLLSGCTTSVDHGYFWPNGCRVDDVIEAVAPLGLRLHACRGAISLGASRGGLPPDEAVEEDDAIIADCERVLARYHDPAPGAMLRIALAPCSPYSVTPALMRSTAALARRHGVGLHTHLAESREERDFCRRALGTTPAGYAESLEWVGADVWFAHGIHLDATERLRLGHHGCGIAHCPCSNMRLGTGIAPVRALREAGLTVGIGTDGAASNDSSHLLQEARQALLLQRAGGGAGALTPAEALELATRGGAAVLGRPELGRLAAGCVGDIAAFRLDDPAFAGGAVHDPLAALVLSPPPRADLVLVHGMPRVRDGRLTGADPRDAVAALNGCVRRLMDAP
ncbi:8-oxoguanine deaminase [Sediminicurvatus halobius]|uniref:8-oxoguanine deaminase n=1 Tax=Sediminicurvatus halobius TaxID=2182432 RepID=A0A2U2N3Q3_9GAMM|nr:8-oxoguanine deaminase [Spiribacter halobius]PWG63687.1 8-oxoguanine deaminase [Spiribacter halobius]UEX79825.1 8-oxoguanine deaminase [Spiribacter halobius]